MKKTIVFTLFLVALSCFIALQTSTATASGSTKIVDCPAPACQSTIIVHLDDGCTSGTWCGPFGSASFTTDDNGYFYATCLCAGTYYFCSDCSTDTYVGYCSGGPTESFATASPRPCPCN